MMHRLLEPTWMKVAVGELGVQEIPGVQANERILEYSKYTTFHVTSDEIAWCSQFANFVMQTSGFPGTRSAAAASWLFYGVRLSEPALGCITVLKRGNVSDEAYKNLKPNQPTYPMAHVGFYYGEYGANYIRVLGGNQSDKVKVSTFSKAMVLGYFWPKEAILHSGD